MATTASCVWMARGALALRDRLFFCTDDGAEGTGTGEGEGEDTVVLPAAFLVFFLPLDAFDDLRSTECNPSVGCKIAAATLATAAGRGENATTTTTTKQGRRRNVKVGGKRGGRRGEESREEGKQGGLRRRQPQQTKTYGKT